MLCNAGNAVNTVQVSAEREGSAARERHQSLSVFGRLHESGRARYYCWQRHLLHQRERAWRQTSGRPYHSGTYVRISTSREVCLLYGAVVKVLIIHGAYMYVVIVQSYSPLQEVWYHCTWIGNRHHQKQQYLPEQRGRHLNHVPRQPVCRQQQVGSVSTAKITDRPLLSSQYYM